ncbi:MAG: MerC domain-containing protein [Verrucomicrobiota bacterium]
MGTNEKTELHTHGWLDSLAISMSLLCAFHCLLTPVLIIVLPILATSFLVDHDFHLWMIFFVVPTTSAAVFLGCRQHRDKAVLILSSIGLTLLVSIAVYESVFLSEMGSGGHTHCEQCDSHESHGTGGLLTASTYLNLLGGLLLASAHVRNYWLCRHFDCHHSH